MPCPDTKSQYVSGNRWKTFEDNALFVLIVILLCKSTHASTDAWPSLPSGEVPGAGSERSPQSGNLARYQGVCGVLCTAHTVIYPQLCSRQIADDREGYCEIHSSSISSVGRNIQASDMFTYVSHADVSVSLDC